MKHNIKFLGKVDDKQWPHFSWEVTINDFIFPYKTGLGHIENKKRYADRKPYKLVGTDMATIPEIDEVLFCLFSDASGSESCFEDWCNDFGYNADSRKALDTYLRCQENSVKLRKALGSNYLTIKQQVEERQS